MKSLQSPDVQWFRSLWYGARHCCLIWAALPSGMLHVAGELVRDRCLIAELAREIRVKTRTCGVEEKADDRYPQVPYIRYTAAWREAMRGKSSQGKDGETRADTFRHNGIIVRETAHDEAQGWTRVSELLGTLPDGRPMLTINPKCEHLIRALTNAVSDPTNPELLLESDHDQPLRALRIGAMSRPAPRPFEAPPLPPNSAGKMLQELRNSLDERSNTELWD